MAEPESGPTFDMVAAALRADTADVATYAGMLTKAWRMRCARLCRSGARCRGSVAPCGTWLTHDGGARMQ